MSYEADVSQVYTNHSIRATGISFLKRNHYSEKQIMAIPGHKSVHSLSIYQKVTSDEKIAMGLSMSYYLQSDNPVVYVPPPPENATATMVHLQNQQLCPIAPKTSGEAKPHIATKSLTARKTSTLTRPATNSQIVPPSTSDINPPSTNMQKKCF